MSSSRIHSRTSSIERSKNAPDSIAVHAVNELGFTERKTGCVCDGQVTERSASYSNHME